MAMAPTLAVSAAMFVASGAVAEGEVASLFTTTTAVAAAGAKAHATPAMSRLKALVAQSVDLVPSTSSMRKFASTHPTTAPSALAP